MSERSAENAEGLDTVSEDAELWFEKRGEFVFAELRRTDGKQPIVLATIRPSLIAPTELMALYYKLIAELLDQLMGRNGIQLLKRDDGPQT